MTAVAFYSALGIHLNGSGKEAAVGCFANPEAHQHGDTTPSCSVNKESGAWTCFACGAGGGPYDAAIATGLPSTYAMELVRSHGLAKDDGTPKAATTHPSTNFSTTDDQVATWSRRLPEATRIIEARGWTAAHLGPLGIGWDGTRFTLPVYAADGTLIGVGRYQADKARRRTGKDKMLQAAGSQRGLFPNPERYHQAQVTYRVIVEGEADAITAAHLRVPVIAVPGTSYRWTAEDTARLGDVQTVYLIPDADPQGRRLMDGIRACLQDSGVKAVVVDLHPDRADGADLTDWATAHDQWPADRNAVARDLVQTFRDAPLVASVALVAQEGNDGAAAEQPARAPELGMDAYHGIAGRFALHVEPHTEASPSGVLISFLAMAGNAIGAEPHDSFGGGERHTAKFWPVLVGPTSAGKKGTATNLAMRFVEMADPTWKQRRAANVGSGEVLVWEVRDDRLETDKKGETVYHPGVTDKRLFIEESEFASMLRVARRDGSILSALLRQAWDRDDLRHTVKHEPATATGAHIGLVGGITATELRKELTSTDAANGFANRFAFVAVKKSKDLPRGGTLRWADLEPLAAELAEAITWAQSVGQVTHDETFWTEYEPRYAQLTAERYGMAGELLARGAPTIRRLAMIYALLDGTTIINGHHARAALAVWDYIEASTVQIFGDAIGDPDADKALTVIEDAGTDGAWVDDIKKAFANHSKYRDALATLERLGRAERVQRDTGGRPRDYWRAIRPRATKATKATKAHSPAPTTDPNPNGRGH